MVRGLSPARPRRGRSQSPSGSGLLRRRRGGSVGPPEILISRSGSLRPGVETLSPLREGPDPNGSDSGDPKSDRWAHWLCRAPSVSTAEPGYSRSDLRLLLGVLGAPLAPVHVSNSDPLPHLCIKDTPIETSSAQYILQQYLAASGGQKLQNSIQNAYAMGKVKMLASDIETATKVIKNKNSSKAAESGGFVLWQMNPDMWYVELALGGSKVRAGCNGKLVWRHTPWLGAHAAKGPVRPLRRALQCVNLYLTCRAWIQRQRQTCLSTLGAPERKNSTERIASFSNFVPIRIHSKPGAKDQQRSYVTFCLATSARKPDFVHLEDSHLTRIQTNGGDAVYWETTINSFLDDYRPVEGIMIAHSGRSVVTLFRFGETAMSHTKTRMEEAWTIEEVAFNVPGLSIDCFIPPAELRFGSISETCELPQEDRVKSAVAAAAAVAYRAKVAALGKSHDGNANNRVVRNL
ncbi:hypothetical protein DH2020_008250 [Rehmannia glutinosa]|uniref:Uncharacterized protein n=1 Tax=Rehmannia glutinosa TaxID=99300 RepID=A0ABR0U0Z8_REHGL